MRVWNQDNCDIRVYIPGPPGPPQKSVGSLTSPIPIVGSIPAPAFTNQRTFLSSSGSNVINPALANAITNDQRWALYWSDPTYNLILNDATNLKLSGQWVAKADSVLVLVWDNVSRWIEDYRNEI